MKIVPVILAIFALSGVAASAKTLNFPNKGNTMFTITIPDDWKPTKDEDEIVEALSPDEHVYLSVWELESEKDAKSLGTDIVDMLKDHAKDIKIEGEGQAAHPGGMDGMLFSGSAKDKEDGHAIEFYALIVSTNAKAAVMFIEADADASKGETEKLTGILQSIKQPAAK